MSDAPELLPCPFCGSPAPRYQMAWGVRCTACDASVPCLGDDFGPWNRRATPAALIREAEARGMERAAMWVKAWRDEAVHPTHYVNMLLAEAAALRGKETT